MTENRQVYGNRPCLTVTDGTANPTIIYFSPGMGEDKAQGTGLDTLDAMYLNGSPFQLAKDGKLSNYVVVSLEGANGSAANTWEVFSVIAAVVAKYGTNGVRIMTGLSIGGQNVLDVAGQDVDKVFTAYVEMSTPGTSTKDWTKLPGKLLAFHGAHDVDPTNYKNSVAAVNAINSVKPGWAYLITKPNDGHNGWPENYSSKFNIPGFGNMTWLEWATAASKDASILFTDSGTTPITTMSTKPIPTLSAKDGIITLDASKSTGNIGSVSWTFAGPANNGSYVEGGNGAPKDLTVQKRLITNKVPGDYVVSLNVWDSNGIPYTAQATITLDKTGNVATQTAPVTSTPPVVVPPPVVIPPAKSVVQTIIIPAKTIKVYSDNTYDIS